MQARLIQGAAGIKKEWEAMHRTPSRFLLTVAVFALLLVPAAAIAAGTFEDVPDGHTFEADIEWLASVDVTRGCNPPAKPNSAPMPR